MTRALRLLLGIFASSLVFHCPAKSVEIPRPEHPTPDAVRQHWANLNGPWQFRFDPKNEGRKAHWETPGTTGFDKTIVVPFPWESELSGVKELNAKGVAWYRREFTVPTDFPKNDHVWLRFGAVDWEADVWVNGVSVAHHEGGYSPFATDITEALKKTEDKPAIITVRVFDPTDPDLPTGKQVGWYTPTSGIWQTVWLEARPLAHIGGFTITPEIEFRGETASAMVKFAISAVGSLDGYTTRVLSRDPSWREHRTQSIATERHLDVVQWYKVESPRLWSPENPELYDVTIQLLDKAGKVFDSIDSYVGLRTIAHGKYGDEAFERILLNGKPVYLRTALDQSFNPKGIYTAPDDDFLKRDLILAKINGLNGLRIHIKPDEPRRLYWADKIGLLILEDMPNTWRQNPKARKAWESTMREVVARDRNHPSIITWVAFNETWGCVTGSSERYKSDTDTQAWVGKMVSEIRKLDPTRLVEDQSPCNYDHVENTDLNSWHFYIDDHEGARRHIGEVVAKTTAGSGFNYVPGQKQGTSPLINSEYGGVGAGNGDRDVSWCFKDLTTLLRHQRKIQGYVYTELADIEWEHNGFVNYDRSLKSFGYDWFLPDMRPNELNGADFVGYGCAPCLVVKPGELVTVPVFISHFSDRKGSPKLNFWIDGYDLNGDLKMIAAKTTRVESWKPYDVVDLEPVSFRAPNAPFVGSVQLTLRYPDMERIAANYVNFVVKSEAPPPRVEVLKKDGHPILRFEPGDFARKRWTGPSAVKPGKVWGQGKGSFDYVLKVPEAIVKAKPMSYYLRFELGSKAGRERVDWPSRVSSEDYPQTDTRTWPSTVEVSINGTPIGLEELDDDSADARGVYSHLSKRDPGSHGQLVEFEGDLPAATKADLAAGKPLVLRLAVADDAAHKGGLCIYGAESGQYPFGPSISLVTELPVPADLQVNPSNPIAIDRQSDRILVPLASGDTEKPAVWSYTTTEPAPAWKAEGFDVSGWSRGASGFGTPQTPGVRIKTRWDTPRVWLRTTIELPELAAEDILTLHEFHDEDIDIFVNDKPLIHESGYITSYRDITLSAAQRTLFRAGTNVIAVSCRQTGGGQGVDVGLTLQLTETPKAAKP